MQKLACHCTFLPKILTEKAYIFSIQLYQFLSGCKRCKKSRCKILHPFVEKLRTGSKLTFVGPELNGANVRKFFELG